jgi:hypothetical protein
MLRKKNHAMPSTSIPLEISHVPPQGILEISYASSQDISTSFGSYMEKD